MAKTRTNAKEVALEMLLAARSEVFNLERSLASMKEALDCLRVFNKR